MCPPTHSFLCMHGPHTLLVSRLLVFVKLGEGLPLVVHSVPCWTFEACSKYLVGLLTLLPWVFFVWVRLFHHWSTRLDFDARHFCSEQWAHPSNSQRCFLLQLHFHCDCFWLCEATHLFYCLLFVYLFALRQCQHRYHWELAYYYLGFVDLRILLWLLRRQECHCCCRSFYELLFGSSSCFQTVVRHYWRFRALVAWSRKFVYYWGLRPSPPFQLPSVLFSSKHNLDPAACNVVIRIKSDQTFLALFFQNPMSSLALLGSAHLMWSGILKQTDFCMVVNSFAGQAQFSFCLCCLGIPLCLLITIFGGVQLLFFICFYQSTVHLCGGLSDVFLSRSSKPSRKDHAFWFCPNRFCESFHHSQCEWDLSLVEAVLQLLSNFYCFKEKEQWVVVRKLQAHSDNTTFRPTSLDKGQASVACLADILLH